MYTAYLASTILLGLLFNKNTQASSGKELDVNAEVRAALRGDKARSWFAICKNCCILQHII